MENKLFLNQCHKDVHLHFNDLKIRGSNELETQEQSFQMFRPREPLYLRCVQHCVRLLVHFVSDRTDGAAPSSHSSDAVLPSAFTLCRFVFLFPLDDSSQKRSHWAGVPPVCASVSCPPADGVCVLMGACWLRCEQICKEKTERIWRHCGFSQLMPQDWMSNSLCYKHVRCSMTVEDSFIRKCK